MHRSLVVYGTRYGATAKTSKEIAKVLCQKGLDVKLVNLKDEEVKDIQEYELIIVGSGIQIGKWTNEPEKFLSKFQQELARKKLALFVCCGGATPLSEGEQKIKESQDAKTKYLEEKASKYSLKPIALGLFGGVYDFNKMSWFFKKTLSGIKPKLEEAGFKETASGIYDTRDLMVIRSWAEEVVKALE